MGPQARVDTSGEIQAIDDLPEGQLAYLISLNYQIQNDNEEQVAHGAVAYIAAYTVGDGPALTEEQIEAFGQGGALFQVHPYIREHVATMCQRSGLTAYVLPMLLHDVRPGAPGDDDASRPE